MRLGSTMANSVPTGTSPVGQGGSTAVAVPAVVVSAPATTVNKTLLYCGLGLLAWMVLKKKRA